MNRIFFFFVCSFLALTAAGLTSCGKGQDEKISQQGTAAHTPFEPDTLTSYTLPNGISVYLLEEHSQPEVAVETLYRAGAIHEGDGQQQVSRMAPLMLLYSATKSFKVGEAVDRLSKSGKVNAETIGHFTHFDYIVPAQELELALQIESERLTSHQFTDELIKQKARKCVDDIEYVVKSPKASLIKYALMAFNQAYNYGRDFVPIYSSAFDLKAKQVEDFVQRFYRPDDMILVIVGDFDTETAKSLIEKYLAAIPSRPKPKINTKHVTGFKQAQWDLPATVFFLVFPGPYDNDTERVFLSMFGGYLRHYLEENSTISQNVKNLYCSSQVYPVSEIPFFVFVHPRPEKDVNEVRDLFLRAIQDAMTAFSPGLLRAMQMNSASFMESSLLEGRRDLEQLPHFQIIGQEALNIGLKQYARGDLQTPEYVKLIDSIDFDEAKAILQKRITAENLVEVRLERRQ